MSMHVLSCLLMPKYSSSRGAGHVVEEVPLEGRACVGGDRKHRGKVVRVELAQETQVHCKAGVMRLALHECVPGVGRPSVLPGAHRLMLMTAMGSNAVAPSGRSGLGLGAQVGDVGRGWEVRPCGSVSAHPWGHRRGSKWQGESGGGK